MTHIRFSEPPPPPERREWCLPCLMHAKAHIVDLHPELTELIGDGKPGEQWVPWDTSIKMYPALCYGLSDEPQLGLVPVCFTHLVFIKHKPGSPLVQGQVPPGLIRGRG